MPIEDMGAISNHSTTETEETLLPQDSIDGFVDYKGNPSHRSNSGGWRSASFITAGEVAERFAYYGVAANLITYLTGPLGQSTATAAANVNAWAGTAMLLPLVGAFVADSFLGRYRTIIVACSIYILGLSLLTLSALPASLDSSDIEINNTGSYSVSQPFIILFLFGLYLVAIGQGGHKPCLQAFGADQFDGQNQEENKKKSSFFNWWYFNISIGIILSFLIVAYIQDNLNWAVGFAIPCIVMIASLFVLLLGTKTYRYSTKKNEENPFARIGRVFVVAIKNRKTTPLMMTNLMAASDDEARETLLCHSSDQQFKFLNKALLPTNGSLEEGKSCTANDIKEAKALLRLIPIWATCLSYAIVFAQSSTFFTKQGATLGRTIFPGFKIPAASLQVFIPATIILSIPIYDRIFVPLARAFTHKSSGITMLQRIGLGIFLTIICMAIAALVEMKRLEVAKEYGLVDEPNVTLPMSVWWLVPQYVSFGLAEVFTMIGLQEFFYEQVPKELRSVGISFFLSIIGVGNFLSSFIVSVINKVTSGDGKESWFADNLNQAHLDYYYWLLAGICVVGLANFMYFSKSYVYI